MSEKGNLLWTALTEMYDLRCEYRDLERKLKAARGTVLSGVSYDGVGGSSGPASPVENLALRNHELIRELTDHLTCLRARQIWLLGVLRDIPDAWARRTLILRFYDGKGWDRVAEELRGHATGASVRDRCRRYIYQYADEHGFPDPPDK